MNWIDLKNSIRQDLLSRGLSNPKIRLNALEKVEEIMKLNLPEYIDQPEKKFRSIDKQKFKELVAKHKLNQKLNSAESSIINEIYYRIECTDNIGQKNSNVLLSYDNKNQNTGLQFEIEKTKGILREARIFFWGNFLFLSTWIAIFPDAVEINGVLMIICLILGVIFTMRLFGVKAHLRNLEKEEYERYIKNL